MASVDQTTIIFRMKRVQYMYPKYGIIASRSSARPNQQFEKYSIISGFSHLIIIS